MTYTIYFEICGKKLKTTVIAKNEADAVTVLKSKLQVHKIDAAKDSNWNTITDMFDDLMDNLRKK